MSQEINRTRPQHKMFSVTPVAEKLHARMSRWQWCGKNKSGSLFLHHIRVYGVGACARACVFVCVCVIFYVFTCLCELVSFLVYVYLWNI